MIKSILVAMDESKASNSALNAALVLSKLTGAILKGLYVEDANRLLKWQPLELMGAGAVIGTSSGIPTPRKTIEQVEIEKEFIKEGNNLKEDFEKSCKKFNVPGKFTIKRGTVEEIIIQSAKMVDFVVVGKRGKTYPESSKEPGPITELLLRRTPRPVLVVPPDTPPSARIHGGELSVRILIAYDGSETAQRALSTGAEFATFQNSEVKVVSIADDIEIADKPLNEAREFFSAYDLKVDYIIDFGYGKPWKAIMQQAKNFDAGLIVLGAYGSNKILELIFGSTTREVLMDAKCPILLCR